jgi:seryl-tRNA synthetase
MHDLRYLRGHRAEAEAAFAKKHVTVDLDTFYRVEEERVALLGAVEELKRQRNQASEEIGRRKREGQDAGDLLVDMKQVSEAIKQKEGLLEHLEARVLEMARWMPNFPHESVPEGTRAEDNVQVAAWGELPHFDFTPRPHWELAERLGLIDFRRGPKLAGSGYPLFWGDGARLVRALIQLMIDLHTTRHGYTLVHPPIVVKSDCLEGTGQLPKLADDMYRLTDEDLWLNPTAEVPVTNIFRDEILDPGQVPTRLVAYCPSFRREAGAYGKDTRGIVRLHQFDKVELVKFVLPERSYDEHEALRHDVEEVLQTLEIPYRLMLLCAGDLSFAAAKCYDFEAWAAGEGRWLEVSSCSNFEQFQARRAGIRFRREAAGKPEHVATLNASGVALPRTVIAILENGQQADGSVRLPRALAPYLGGIDTLRPPAGA